MAGEAEGPEEGLRTTNPIIAEMKPPPAIATPVKSAAIAPTSGLNCMFKEGR